MYSLSLYCDWEEMILFWPFDAYPLQQQSSFMMKLSLDNRLERSEINRSCGVARLQTFKTRETEIFRVAYIGPWQLSTEAIPYHTGRSTWFIYRTPRAVRAHMTVKREPTEGEEQIRVMDMPHTCVKVGGLKECTVTLRNELTLWFLVRYGVGEFWM